jgi:L1 cell adhesion molecule like protein
MGKKFTDPSTQEDIALVPYKVEAGPNNEPLIVVSYKKEVRKYYTHEIASMLIAKLKQDAEVFTG